ncbi:O-methyltransferase [Colletotrichum tabaci]|uniref:O-methyltransferase n=1 Tax=Colletotrichum tabaci TaxID=1209068 RepID=A0AAV9SUU4_9PEZI
MQSESAVLYPNPIVGESVYNYACAKSLSLPPYIEDYHAWIYATQGRMAMMSSSVFQGKSLHWLARAIGAKRVLEIGVYLGFTSLVWADAVGPRGKVVGLELSAEYASQARKIATENAVQNVEVVEGDAVKLLGELSPEEAFDIIFIDADKERYPAYLASILEKSQAGEKSRLLRPGGIIIADNVIRRGLVANSTEDNPWAERFRSIGLWSDKDMEALDSFNTEVATNPRLENLLLPLFDGMGMSRLVD